MAEDSLSGTLSVAGKEGLDRLLLAPVYLIHEIFAALVPGVVFVGLLLINGNRVATSLFQNSLLGYRTRLLLALVLAYIFGKISVIPAEVAIRFSVKRWAKSIAKSESSESRDTVKKLVIGMFVLPAIFKAEHVLDYLILSLTVASFYISTGVTLLVFAVLANGRSIRATSIAIGLLFCARGFVGMQNTFKETFAAMLGVALSDRILKMLAGTPAEILQAGIQLLTKYGVTASAASSKPDTGSPGTNGKT